MGVGLGLPVTKSNTFIKKAINWYQKKTQGGCRMKQRGTKGRQRGINTLRKTGGEGRCRELGLLMR